MSPRDFGMMVVLASLWGASYLFIREAAPIFGPALLMELRVLIAGVLIAGYAIGTKRAPKLRGEWRRFLALGAINGAAPFALIATAELYIPASLAAILNATTPLFAAVVATIWFNEQLSGKRIAGLVIGVFGVSVLVGWSPVPLNAALLFATVASLLGALAYGLGGTFAARGFRGTPPLTMAIGQQFGAAIALCPFALFSIPRAHVTVSAVGNLLGLAILSTGVAYLIYFPLLRNVGPTRALSVTFLVPVFGLVWGALFLRESVSPGTIVGLAIILSSVTLVTGVRLWPGGAAGATAAQTAGNSASK